MARADKDYHELLETIVDEGYVYTDESRDVDLKQINSYNLHFKYITTSFPLLTTKKMSLHTIATELCWFLKGYNSLDYLHEHKVHIWDKDAKNKFKGKSNPKDLGRIYGKQWRNFHGINIFDSTDQILELIENLRENPMSRRHIVTAWNPNELEYMALPPCHWAFEIIVQPPPQKLDFLPPIIHLKWHQRSVDTFLGLPFNIASYGMLLVLIGELTGYVIGDLYGDLSNVHIYEPHNEAVQEQLSRNTEEYESPQVILSYKLRDNCRKYREGEITLNDVLDALEPSDFILENYESYPAIKAEMIGKKQEESVEEVSKEDDNVPGISLEGPIFLEHPKETVKRRKKGKKNE